MVCGKNMLVGRSFKKPGVMHTSNKGQTCFRFQFQIPYPRKHIDFIYNIFNPLDLEHFDPTNYRNSSFFHYPYKETWSELTETCPNQDVIIDKFLSHWTNYCQFEHFFVNFLSLYTFFYHFFLSFIMS